MRINQVLREERTAILAIQEAHLDQAYVDQLLTLFGARLSIHFSASPGRERTAHGVAFVINKDRLDASQISSVDIIPGRAILLKVVWHKGTILHILNVYAPNVTSQNALFWEELTEKFSSNSFPRPDIILGDFNVVEDAIDRLPARNDPVRATSALYDLHSMLGLVDGWRTENPHEKSYTYAQDHGTSLSRLDRVYLTPELAKSASDWVTKVVAGIPTDHSLVSVTISDRSAPYIGKGRWVFPRAALSDHAFTAYVISAGRTLLQSIPDDNLRDEHHNVQTLYAQFKRDVTKRARDSAKVNIPKLNRRIMKLRTERSRGSTVWSL
ncbi:DNase I-like protein [Trametopsis cervina]|nr:DNase I-like protein [Trametopsis cervina]